MEYYEKSLKLVKFMLGFVVFCVIYANFMQPKVNEAIKNQQEQLIIQQAVLSKQQKESAASAANEDELVKKSLQELKNLNPDMSQADMDKAEGIIRANIRNSLQKVND